MTYSKKKTMTGMDVAVLSIILYCIYSFGESMPAPMGLEEWAKILVSIGTGFAAVIVLRILYRVRSAISRMHQRHKRNRWTMYARMPEDARHPAIRPKASTVGYNMAGFGGTRIGMLEDKYV